MADVHVDYPKDEKPPEEEKAKGGCCGKAKKEKPPPPPEVPLSRLLSMAPDAYWMMGLGAFCSLANGATFPAFSVIFGTVFNVFFDITVDVETRRWEISKMSIIFVAIGVATFLLTYLTNLLWIVVGERITKRLRLQFMNAVLHQEGAFFDKTQSGILVSRLSADIILVQGGVSEKLGQVFYYAAQVIGGLIVAFVYGWKMTLVMLATAPVMVVVGGLQSMILTAKSKNAQDAYAEANDIASEAFSGVKTVYSFVSEEKMVDRYDENLSNAYKVGIKRAHFTGAGSGFAFFFMFAVYGLGFWYGGQLILSGESAPGNILTVFFSVVIGAMGLGQGGSITPDIAKAKGAGAALFEVIDRVPLINLNEGTGKTLDKLKGKIQFKNVKFAYPSRPEVTVMEKFSLTIKSGTTVALVGPSGGGKSTTVQLIERFYDVSDGSISIDGVDIREFDLKWLRTHIGLVSQEPILFSGTIEQNIRFGKTDATEEEIIAAAKAANAHNFIKDLAAGYNTQVGEKGASLSGGQKQRIAIARAMLKDPKILLLDEATSALDAESEHLVQEALDRLMRGRTTIVIAHRLTTVRDADKICVIQKGSLAEEGTHDELIERKGVYFNLVSRQLASADDSTEVAKAPKSDSTKKRKAKKSER